jgi:tetratricopeptide (TPR) repeat protein
MAPLRFIVQFLSLALLLGSFFALIDRDMIRGASTTALASADAARIAPPAPRYAEGGLASDQSTRLQRLVLTADTGLDRSAFLLSSREQRRPYAPANTPAAPNTPSKAINKGSSRVAMVQMPRVLGFVPNPIRRPQRAIGTPIPAGVAQEMEPASIAQVQVRRFNQAGYDALALGDTRAALQAFSSSIDTLPDQPLIHSQMGYILKGEGKLRAAGKAFNQAIAFTPVRDRTAALTREASSLGRPLRFDAYTVWREDSQPEADISFGPSLAQSQSGIAAAYRLPVDGWAGQRGLSVYSRLLWAYEPMRFALNDESFQAGVGVQLRPIKGLNLVAAAERLIAFGNDARDDWLVRASYSAGQGYAPLEGERSWLHWSVYGDFAMIDPADPDLQITGEGRVGFGQRPFQASSFTVMPFAGLSANFQDAAGITTSLYEAGTGLWMRYWPGGQDIPDPQRALDLRVEYRSKLGGDSASSSGLRVTFGLSY